MEQQNVVVVGSWLKPAITFRDQRQNIDQNDSDSYNERKGEEPFCLVENGLVEGLQRISATSSWFKPFFGVFPHDTRLIFNDIPAHPF